jgi:hypothetical protein
MFPADRQLLLKVRFEKVRVSQLQPQRPKPDLNSLAGTMALSHSFLILTSQFATSNITLTAQWSALYTVTYSQGLGSGTPATEPASYSEGSEIIIDTDLQGYPDLDLPLQAGTMAQLLSNLAQVTQLAQATSH